MAATGTTIALVRHGPAAAALPAGRLTREGLLAWRATYELAGLAPGARPPAALARLAGTARVVASGLPRAAESAALIAGGATVEQSALLREIDLPVPAWFPAGLPPLAWATLIHLEWLWAGLRGRDAAPAARAQARTAADWLAGLAGRESPVVAVTHGVVRRLVAQELERSGWSRMPGLRRYHYWSAWLLTRR